MGSTTVYVQEPRRSCLHFVHSIIITNWAYFCVTFFLRYLVTFSPLIDTREEPQAIIIWDIRTGAKKRGFHCENAAQWPIFK